MPPNPKKSHKSYEMSPFHVLKFFNMYSFLDFILKPSQIRVMFGIDESIDG